MCNHKTKKAACRKREALNTVHRDQEFFSGHLRTKASEKVGEGVVCLQKEIACSIRAKTMAAIAGL